MNNEALVQERSEVNNPTGEQRVSDWHSRSEKHLIKVTTEHKRQTIPDVYNHAPKTDNQAEDDFILECSIQAKLRAKVEGRTEITWYINMRPHRTMVISS